MIKALQLIIFTVLISFSTLSYGQTRLPGSSDNSTGSEVTFDFSEEEQLKKDIDEIGLAVANKLMNCCSTWGGTNVGASVDYDEVRMNETTGSFTIPMTVKWQGSLSGNQYWIKGKLVVNNNGRMSWLKIKDSGGFYPGCSKDCIQ